MAQCANGFQKGVVNNAVTIASGEGDPTAWDQVNLGTGGTFTYDGTVGGVNGIFACKAVGPSAGAASLLWNTAFGTNTDHYGRIYAYVTAVPASSLVLVQANNSTGLCGRVFIGNNQKILVGDSTGGGIAQTTVSYPLNQWFRVEWHFIHSLTVGFVEAKLANPFTTVITDTCSASGLNTQADATNTRFAATLPNGVTIWMGGIIAGATSYQGPVSTVNQPGLLAAGSGVF